MAKTAAKTATAFEGLTELMERHADALSSQLQAHHLKVFPPTSEKGIRGRVANTSGGSYHPAKAGIFMLC